APGRYAALFGAFPAVTFCVSAPAADELSLAAGSFANVVSCGHGGRDSGIPAAVEQGLRLRLQAVPQTKQVGSYSDMTRVEFGLRKFLMYRRALARVLADDFVRPQLLGERQAMQLARLLLRDNARWVFGV